MIYPFSRSFIGSSPFFVRRRSTRLECGSVSFAGLWMGRHRHGNKWITHFQTSKNAVFLNFEKINNKALHLIQWSYHFHWTLWTDGRHRGQPQKRLFIQQWSLLLNKSHDIGIFGKRWVFRIVDGHGSKTSHGRHFSQFLLFMIFCCVLHCKSFIIVPLLLLKFNNLFFSLQESEKECLPRSWAFSSPEWKKSASSEF